MNGASGMICDTEGTVEFPEESALRRVPSNAPDFRAVQLLWRDNPRELQMNHQHVQAKHSSD
jgi:hypothetical protein